MRSPLLRLWLAFLLATAAQVQAQTFPGAPVLTVVGPASCGARLYAPGQVQTYCLYLNPPSAAQTVCNALDSILPSPPPPSQVDGTHSCFIHDPNGIYEITWLYFQPAGSSVITYQIAQQFFPAVGVPPPTTNQSGTF